LSTPIILDESNDWRTLNNKFGKSEMSLLEEHINNAPWPRKGDVLFKADDDWWNTACLNFLHSSQELELYARGYKQAADILVDHISAMKRYQDMLVYPIVFLYRHYIELCLKEIFRDGNILLDEPKEIPIHHKIDELWKDCKIILKKLQRDSIKDDLEAVDEIITQFSEMDPSSFAFRYPTDTKGKKSLPDIRHINLRNLAEILDRIEAFFVGVSSVIGELLDFKRDMQSDF
jgi:hypothetical protein